MPRVAPGTPSREFAISRERWAPIALVASAVIVLITAFGFLIRNWSAWTDGEMRFLQVVSDHHTEALDSLTKGIDTALGPVGAVIITLVLAAIIAWRTRGLRSPMVFVALTLIPWLGSAVVKMLVARPRPDQSLLSHPFLGDPGKYSYPSGHTAFAASLVIALALTLTSGRWRTAIISCGVALVAVTACSRVYLGVHYPTDVIASIVLMPAGAALLVALVVRFVPRLAVSQQDRSQ